jgi:hypothetical protein
MGPHSGLGCVARVDEIVAPSPQFPAATGVGFFGEVVDPPVVATIAVS